jgi:hypothetical protein
LGIVYGIGFTTLDDIWGEWENGTTIGDDLEQCSQAYGDEFRTGQVTSPFGINHENEKVSFD